MAGSAGQAACACAGGRGGRGAGGSPSCACAWELEAHATLEQLSEHRLDGKAPDGQDSDRRFAQRPDRAEDGRSLWAGQTRSKRDDTRRSISNQTRVSLVPCRVMPQRSLRVSTRKRPRPPGRAGSRAWIIGTVGEPPSVTTTRTSSSPMMSSSTISWAAPAAAWSTLLVTSSPTSRTASRVRSEPSSPLRCSVISCRARLGALAPPSSTARHIVCASPRSDARIMVVALGLANARVSVALDLRHWCQPRWLRSRLRPRYEPRRWEEGDAKDPPARPAFLCHALEPDLGPALSQLRPHRGGVKLGAAPVSDASGRPIGSTLR